MSPIKPAGSEPVDLVAQRDQLLSACRSQLDDLVDQLGDAAIACLDSEPVVEISYPVQSYPHKVKSLSFDKTPDISGILNGIKGQYLILDTGVLNIRKFGGYHISLET